MRPPGLADGARVVAALWAVVAGAAFAASRLGLALFGVGEPIVELTAVHYTYAGSAALVLAIAAHEQAPRRGRRWGAAAVALTAVAPVVVATGFVTRTATAQVGGAALMTLGVWCTASLELGRAARRTTRRIERIALAVSGLAIWIPMVLAVLWAAGQHWDVPALGIPSMARTHGLANALGFVLAGLVARHIATTHPHTGARSDDQRTRSR